MDESKAMEDFTGVPQAAAFEAERLRAAVSTQAVKVARLGIQRREARKRERELTERLRMERRFLRAMLRDLEGRK